MKLDKTAVEWLIENSHIIPKNELNKKELINQAKELEEQQIQEAFYRGIQEQTQRVLFRNPEITEPEDYYKNTFGK